MLQVLTKDFDEPKLVRLIASPLERRPVPSSFAFPVAGVRSIRPHLNVLELCAGIPRTETDLLSGFVMVSGRGMMIEQLERCSEIKYPNPVKARPRVTDAATCTYRHEGREPDIRCAELSIPIKSTAVEIPFRPFSPLSHARTPLTTYSSGMKSPASCR